MKYLICIELLNLALKQLKAGRRDLIPLSALDAVQILLMQARNNLTGTAIPLCDDVVLAIDIMKQQSNMVTISSDLKNVVISGIRGVLEIVCADAWDYYKTEDVPVQEGTIDALKTVVYYHYGMEGVE